jgi:hypothetical protein
LLLRRPSSSRPSRPPWNINQHRWALAFQFDGKGHTMTDDPREGARTLAARYRSTAAAARRRAVKLQKRKLNEVAEKYETLARCVEDMVDRLRPNPTDKQSW